MATLQRKKDFLLSGDNIDFKKFKELYEQGKLYLSTIDVPQACNRTDSDIKLSEEKFNIIRMMCKTLEDMHPGAWNLDLVLREEDSILIRGITIHYPKITITNSSGTQHEMEDFYVQIPIALRTLSSSSQDYIFLGVTHGCKTTYTNVEANYGYMHSHISFGPTRNYFSSSIGEVSAHEPLRNFHNFCEGSGLINTARLAFNRSQSEEDFIAYILHVARLASWESQEGGPHKLMYEVVRQTRHITASSTDNSAEGLNPPTSRDLLCLNSMVHILLNLHHLNNRNFYIKYEITKDIFGVENIAIQNEEAIFAALVETYKKVVKESDSFEVTITHPVEQGNEYNRAALPFPDLSRYFQYSVTNPTSRRKVLKAIDVRRLFVPENNVLPTEPFTYEEFPNTVLFFRGKEVKLKRKNLTATLRHLSNLDLDLVEDLDVREGYKNKIISIIKEKITKNVKIIRNARTESSGEPVN